jgi:hypothetical protein
MAETELLRRLSAGVYLRSPMSGDVLALVSPMHADGVVAPVYRDAQSAASRANFHYGKVGRNFVPVGVADPVALARKLAGFGFTGITIDEQLPVYFLNRADDPSGELPTLVGIRGETGWTFADTTGPVAVASDQIVPWRDFSLLDPRTRQWMGEGPFPTYEADMPLYEVRVDPVQSEDAVVVRPDGADLLGPYVSDQGAVTLFSDIELANALREQLQNGAPYRLASFTPAARRVEMGEAVADSPGSATSDSRRLRVVEIKDVPGRLDRHLAEQGPFLDIGLNSPGHRFGLGYFFRGSASWYLRTITGTWQVDSPFRLTSAKVASPKADTVDGGR